MQMISTRVFFKKTGRLKYISHLDTMNAFSRALSRSNLPVWYTEGFNPHIYLTFALPLSLGYEGQHESFDIRFTQEVDPEVAKEALNKVLPPEMQVLEVAAPVEEPTAIGWADYLLEIEYPEHTEDAKKAFEAYVAQNEILVEKKSKKGMKQVDISPYVEVQAVDVDDKWLLASVCLASGDAFNVNPRLLVDGFAKAYGSQPESVLVTRKEIYKHNKKVFA